METTNVKTAGGAENFIDNSAKILDVKISDEKLLKLCDEFGGKALHWRRKFVGLLPEVNKRELYKRRGCQSIYEFAAKVAGVSEDQVELALRLEKKFYDKPALHEILVEGKVGLCKLVRVAKMANSENDEELAGKVQLLSQRTLETFVRDERKFTKENEISTMENGSAQPLFGCEKMRTHFLDFEISEEVAEELNRLNEQGQDVNAILLQLLKQRNVKIQEKKQEIAEQMLEKAAEKAPSHHVPAVVESILKEEFGEKCSIAKCTKPATEFHHTQRFAVCKNHDPRYIAPLCKEHHQLAHLADLKYEEMRKAKS